MRFVCVCARADRGIYFEQFVQDQWIPNDTLNGPKEKGRYIEDIRFVLMQPIETLVKVLLKFVVVGILQRDGRKLIGLRTARFLPCGDKRGPTHDFDSIQHRRSSTDRLIC